MEKGLGSFSLEFDLPEETKCEFRIFGTGQVGLIASRIPRVGMLGEPFLPPVRPGSVEREWDNEAEFLDGYLRNISGIIHVGANSGQEREHYKLLGLDVVWVEPIDEVYNKLIDNIAGFSRQIPVKSLLSDQSGIAIEFNIANNGGASSSILPFEQHAELWPDIQYQEIRRIVTTTLSDLMIVNGFTTDVYQGLTLDVEGAELMVLRGAGDLLSGFRYIKCEVADFIPRTGSPTVKDLDDYLTSFGFRQLCRRPFALGPRNEGTYWDIVWKKAAEPFQREGVRTPIVSSSEENGLDKVAG